MDFDKHWEESTKRMEKMQKTALRATIVAAVLYVALIGAACVLAFKACGIASDYVKTQSGEKP